MRRLQNVPTLYSTRPYLVVSCARKLPDLVSDTSKPRPISYFYLKCHFQYQSVYPLRLFFFLNDNSIILLNYGLATGFPQTLPSIVSLSRPYTRILSLHTSRQVYLHAITCNYAHGKKDVTYFRRSETSCVCVCASQKNVDNRN
jgi:hypothetical protein